MLGLFYYYKVVEYYIKDVTEKPHKTTRNNMTINRDSHWIDVALLRPGESAFIDKKESPVVIRKPPDDISWWSWKGGPPTRK